MFILQSDIRSAIQIAATYYSINNNPKRCYESKPPATIRTTTTTLSRLKPLHASSSSSAVERLADKPPICTADELHYVSIHNSDWRLALWRYKPPKQVFLYF